MGPSLERNLSINASVGPLPRPVRLACKAYTVGWICALSTESTAAQVFLDQAHEKPDDLPSNDSNDYVLGRIGKHNVVITVLPDGEYGIASAAVAATELQRSFPSIRLGLMVGVGGGAPSSKHDIRLGDVVVSSPRDGKGGVFQYDFGKTIQNQTFHSTGTLDMPPTALRTALSGLRSEYDIHGHRIDDNIQAILKAKPNMQMRFARPTPESDRLYQAHVTHPPGEEADCRLICSNDPAHFVKRKERGGGTDSLMVHYGTIASANRVMRDAWLRDKLAKENGILCFEMEAAGLMNHFPCLVIRGICDYSDTHKNKDWQGYAAMTAAAYAKDLICRMTPSKVVAERKLGEIASVMKGLADISVGHSHISQKQLDVARESAQVAQSDRRAQCLQLFRLTTSGTDTTYESQKERVESRVEGTCMWVLEHEMFTTWLDKETGPLLVSADPGCGKSVLAKYLIDDVLPNTFMDSTICYFFFREQDQNSVCQALCALLHQLLCKRPKLLKHAIEQFEKDGAGLVDSIASLWSVFNNALRDANAGPVIVVVDALDECAGAELRDFLRNVERQCRDSKANNGKLRYLLTSRPYDQILSLFRNIFTDAYRLRIPGEDESDTISHEVNLVIKYRVQRLAAQKDLSDELRDHLAEQLLRIPHRTYLWVYLVFHVLERELLKKTKMGMTSATKALPKGVNDAYSRILSKSKEDSMVHKTLAIIVGAARPLSLAEMNVVMNLEAEVHELEEIDLEPELDFKHRLRAWCGLFVSVSQGKIYLIHQTAREFLLAEPHTVPTATEALRWQHFISHRQAQIEIADLCMRFLNLRGIRPGPLPDTDRESSEPGETMAFLRYAAEHWSSHFRKANFGPKDTDAINAALKLLDPESSAYLAWFPIYCEALYRSDPGFSKPLEVATHLGLSVVVDHLLQQGAHTESKDRTQGRTPLSWAISGSYDDIAILLLNHGADPNASSEAHGSVLEQAVRASNRNMGRLLLTKGAKVEMQTEKHGTALHVAATASGLNLAIIDLLLEKGADVNAHGGPLGSALCAAAWMGNSTTVDFLLGRGADVNAQGGFGGPALTCAAFARSLKIVKMLLQQGADINAHGGDYDTALGAAAFQGEDDIVKLLLSKGANINDSVVRYGTALGAALFNKHKSVVDLLLSKNADIHKEGGYYNNAVGAAAYAGDKAAVELLLSRGANLHVHGYIYNNALCAAAAGGSRDIVELILDNGVDVNEQGGWYGSALGAAAHVGSIGIVELLLDKGADHSALNKYGETPLKVAASQGHLTVIEILLQRGAEIDVTARNGRSPLLSACEHGSVRIVEVLLNHGAKWTADRNGWAPLNLAADYGRTEVVKLLLSKEADCDDSNHDGRTALHSAAAGGHIEIAELLLAHLADCGSVDCHGWTPLHFACRGGHLEIAELLIKHDTDISSRTNALETPLHVAALSGKHEIVRLLLDRGAEPDQRDNFGYTPLMVAARRDYVEVAKLLLENGADPWLHARDNWTVFGFAVDSGETQVASLLLEKGAYVEHEGRDSRHGTMVNSLAFHGRTDLLRWIIEHYGPDLSETDTHNRTPLQLAARGGHLEVFNYLESQGLRLDDVDARGEDLINLAASGGSCQILRTVLKTVRTPTRYKNRWSPLHWACRSGVIGVADLLLHHKSESTTVTMPEMEGEWTPLAIALYHGNDDFVETLPAFKQVLLGGGKLKAPVKGVHHGGVICDGCLHDIYGPRFQCSKCQSFDYCFMCKPFLKHLHPNHKWKMYEFWDPTKPYFEQKM